MDGTPVSIHGGLIARLEAAGRAVRDAAEVHRTQLDERDRLILEAADVNVPQRAIARATGLSAPTIVEIIRRRSTVTVAG